MKDVIIAALGAYIFYGLCDEKHVIVFFLAFAMLLELVVKVDQIYKELRKEGKIDI